MKKDYNNLSKKYDGWELEYFDNSKNFRKYQYLFIKDKIKKFTAEVGPGNGEILNFYVNKVYKIDLYEPSKNIFKNLKQKYFKNKKITIFNKKFTSKRNKYDTIIYLDVLEHIKNDKQEIINAYNSLKKGGNLIINVPAFNHLYSQFDKDVGHYRRYNLKMILRLTKGLKYRSLNYKYYDSIGYFLSLISRLTSTNYKNHFSKKIKIWNSLIFLSKIIDTLTFNFFGKSLLIFIKK